MEQQTHRFMVQNTQKEEGEDVQPVVGFHKFVILYSAFRALIRKAPKSLLVIHKAICISTKAVSTLYYRLELLIACFHARGTDKGVPLHEQMSMMTSLHICRSSSFEDHYSRGGTFQTDTSLYCSKCTREHF